jgi:hypothetical protein
MSRSEEFHDAHDVSYHITDNPHFALDPTHKPENNAVSVSRMGELPPGVFTTKHPESWVNGHGYVRPYVAEIHSDPKTHVRGGFGSESFIRAEHFGSAKVARVIPLDAHAREEFGSHGWIEEHHGTPTTRSVATATAGPTSATCRPRSTRSISSAGSTT